MKKFIKYYVIFLLTAVLVYLSVLESRPTGKTMPGEEKTVSGNLKMATLGAGCFWCVEAIFENLEGVHKVESGYAGGDVENPTYEAVCSGITGHAEVTRITFDPTVISFAEILDVFFKTHDPTTLNKQGADVGTQYRSAIFYHDEEQKQTALESKKAAADLWDNLIVTEITELQNYYPAENYHQNYFEYNPNQPYCRFVINPKITKFKKEHSRWG